MNPQEFSNSLDEEKIVAAIGEAERKTSGQIRVYISHRNFPDALARARSRFTKLGMARTRQRNAVLLYLAPRTRVFAIVGDTGVHEKCGDAFWQEVAAQLSGDLKSGPPTDAVVRAVEKIGALLAAHFPPGSDDGNELADGIARD